MTTARKTKKAPPKRTPTRKPKAAKPSRTPKAKPAPKRTPAANPTPAKRPAARAPTPSPTARAVERRPPLQPRPEPAHQLGLPDIDQVRDEAMENHYGELVDAKDARKAAQKRIHDVEAAIQIRFDELAAADPDDPRAKIYIVANGAPLKPTTVHKISCGRPPALPKKALEEAQRQAASDDAGGPTPTDPPDYSEGDEE